MKARLFFFYINLIFMLCHITAHSEYSNHEKRIIIILFYSGSGFQYTLYIRNKIIEKKGQAYFVQVTLS